MARIKVTEDAVRITLDSREDIWFWERRFNVFDFLEFFPIEAVAESQPEGGMSKRGMILNFATDAGFEFTSDIVRDGFFLRNQSHGTRRWMNEAKPQPGDTIVIEKTDVSHYRLCKDSVT